MSWRFEIQGSPDPQTLPRIVGYFAQRWTTPSSLVLQMRDGLMRVEISVEDLDTRQAKIVVAKLQEDVLICDATIQFVE